MSRTVSRACGGTWIKYISGNENAELAGKEADDEEGMEGATGKVHKDMEGLVIEDVKGLVVMSANVISESLISIGLSHGLVYNKFDAALRHGWIRLQYGRAHARTLQKSDSGGLAQVTNAPWMSAPAGALCMLFAIFSAHTYSLLGLCCQMLHANSYTELWSKTVSPKTAWMPNTACFTFTWLCCAMYTIIIRDMLRSLLLAIGMAEAWTSKESVCAMMGDYAKGGRFFQLLALERRPKFGDEINISKLLVLISYFHGCYQVHLRFLQVHFDAPKFFHSLVWNKLPMLLWCFTIAGLVGAGLMIAGFLTFGEHSESLLLNNYHSNDQLATWARLATLVSILCRQEFATVSIFHPPSATRSSSGDRQTVKVEGVHFYSCLPPLPRLLRAPCSPPSDGSLLRWLSLTDNRTFWRLIVATCENMLQVLERLGIIASLSGSILGACIIFVFPPLIHMGCLDKKRKEGAKLSLKEERMYVTSYITLILGLLFGLFGVVVSLASR
ncbi:hypothetical protein GUITHDRAFT_99838 [Guillardia theta CCMP2712]|uniref:Amino acid transporter transmembrane domain-containing protein n=1 Tax=Guillardia theta (strain CCMP2712) TaxID=905079 RepID=L1K0K2_GUITC|nr:hypothetical protein GUITHDRAFT_99838 [Guillardia theta CCMP2712]EKX54356.1 hypothetical protein GUITHDRAFT_99838 [Guillardia theta CCMP2712]|eukprot:XP_005841336.1 hypothetical protein GUITHDRAFT_99838 [Guillardia theta CCMP2712]